MSKMIEGEDDNISQTSNSDFQEELLSRISVERDNALENMIQYDLKNEKNISRIMAMINIKPEVDVIIPEPTNTFYGNATTLEKEFTLIDEGKSYRCDFSLENNSKTFKLEESITLKKDRLKAMRHEIVSKAFNCKKTDEKMSVIYKMNNDSDRRTPDIIIDITKISKRGQSTKKRFQKQKTYKEAIEPIEYGEVKKTYMVVELKTSKATMSLNKYNLKNRIYEKDLKDRSVAGSFCIFYFTVICFSDGIITNLPAINKTKDLLYNLYYTGLMVENFMLRNDIMTLDDQQLYTIRKEMDEAIKRSGDISYQTRNEYLPFITEDDRFRFESDDDPLEDHYLVAMTKALDEMENDLKDNVDEIEKLKEKMKGNLRRDRKKLFRLPFISSSLSQQATESTFPKITAIKPIANLWRFAFNGMIGDYKDNFKAFTTEEHIAMAMNEIMPNEDMRKKHHRIKIQMSLEEREYLWQKGVQAKKEAKSKRNWKLNRKRRVDKEPFHLDTPTDDIEQFIRNDIYKLFEPHGCLQDTYRNRLSNLIDYTKNTGGENQIKLTEKLVENFMNTKLAFAMDALNEIYQELNVSMNHFCDRDIFEVKKIESKPIWLLIKGLGATNKIFFSVLYKGDALHFDAFKKSKRIGDDCYATDFISMDKYSLTHMIGCTEKLMCFFYTVCHIFKKDLFDFNDITRDKDVMEHFACLMLFYLSNKAQTSAQLQLIRYAYMESMRMGQLPKKPLKICRKLTPLVRDRFLIFVYKNLFSALTRMSELPPKMKNMKGLREKFSEKTSNNEELLASVPSGDKVDNLVSWVTLRPVKRFEIMLNFSYLGYLYNKDSGDIRHGHLKIFNKIMQQELLMRDVSDDHLGRTNVAYDDLKTHEFDLSFAKKCAIRMKSYLEKMTGGLHDKIREDMYDSNIRNTLDKMATVKASAHFETNDDLYDSISGESRKVIEGIKELLQMGYSEHPFNNLDRLIQKSIDNGGVRVKLFRKNQIGSSREIFILDIIDRLQIFFLESISRSICNLMPNEMLTKGKEKIRRSVDHNVTVAVLRKKYGFTEAVTGIDSDDATTWCQRFVMRLFGVFVTILFPPEMVKPCLLILNNVTSKKLELPKKFLEMFLLNPNEKSYSPEINELKAQFLGKTDKHDLINTGGKWLKNRSNMMQGILHYTSGLIHSAYLLQLEDYNQMVLKQFIISKRLPSESRLLITTKCSSDDSSIIRTILCRMETNNVRKKLKYIKNINIALMIMSKMKKLCYKYLSIQQSEEKSTSNTFSNIEEFNSIFMVRNTMISPMIKFVYSSLTISVQTRMENRQNALADLRKQIIENGGSFLLSSIVMISQCYLHYYTLGLITNPIFDAYAASLLKKPHPIFGLYLFENENICGLLGYDYAHYNWIMNNKKANQIEKTMYNRKNFLISDTGRPTISVSFLPGLASSYIKFRKRINIPVDWKAYYLEDPERLIDPVRSNRACLSEIYKKVSNPDIARSFTFDSGDKMYRSSVYILNRKSVTISSKDASNERTWSGLFKILVEFPVEDIMMDEKDIKFLYQSSELYDIVNDKIKTMTETYSGTRNLPKRFINIKSPKKEIHTTISLTNIVKRLWFKREIIGSNTEYNSALLTWKRNLPWLKDNHADTLKDSPFDDYISLFEFIRSQINMSRTYRILTTANSSRNILTELDGMLRLSWMDGFIRFKKSSYTSKSKMIRATDCISKLSMIYDLPEIEVFFKARSKSDIIRKIIENSYQDYSDEDLELSTKNLNKNVSNVSLLAYYYRLLDGNEDLTDELKIKFLDHILHSKRGVYGYFSLEQSFNKKTYTFGGYGEYTLMIDQDVFKFSINGDDVIMITMRQKSKLEFIKKFSVIKEHLNKIGIDFLDLTKRRSFSSFMKTSNIKNYFSDQDAGKSSNKALFNFKKREYVYNKRSIVDNIIEITFTEKMNLILDSSMSLMVVNENHRIKLKSVSSRGRKSEVTMISVQIERKPPIGEETMNESFVKELFGEKTDIILEKYLTNAPIDVDDLRDYLSVFRKKYRKFIKEMDRNSYKLKHGLETLYSKDFKSANKFYEDMGYYDKKLESEKRIEMRIAFSIMRNVKGDMNKDDSRRRNSKNYYNLLKKLANQEGNISKDYEERLREKFGMTYPGILENYIINMKTLSKNLEIMEKFKEWMKTFIIEYSVDKFAHKKMKEKRLEDFWRNDPGEDTVVSKEIDHYLRSTIMKEIEEEKIKEVSFVGAELKIRNISNSFTSRDHSKTYQMKKITDNRSKDAEDINIDSHDSILTETLIDLDTLNSQYDFEADLIEIGDLTKLTSILAFKNTNDAVEDTLRSSSFYRFTKFFLSIEKHYNKKNILLFNMISTNYKISVIDKTDELLSLILWIIDNEKRPTETAKTARDESRARLIEKFNSFASMDYHDINSDSEEFSSDMEVSSDDEDEVGEPRTVKDLIEDLTRSDDQYYKGELHSKVKESTEVPDISDLFEEKIRLALKKRMAGSDGNDDEMESREEEEEMEEKMSDDKEFLDNNLVKDDQETEEDFDIDDFLDDFEDDESV
jgi:hypothetical protein